MCLVLAWIAVWLSFLLVGVVFCLFVHLFSAPVHKFFHAPLVWFIVLVYLYIGAYIVVFVSGCFLFAGPFQG